MTLLPVLLTIASYLLGSVPVGVIVGRLRGFDPRAVGSGNIGMTNVARAGGGSAAAITFGGDLLKGLIPVLVARGLEFGPLALVAVALAAFIGSIFSVFLRFGGGRGISASFGVWLGLFPLSILVALGGFLIIVIATRIVSLASITAAIILPPATAALGAPRPFIFAAIVMSALVLLRHEENIRRLIRGQEQPFKPGSAKKSRTGSQ